MTWQDFYKRTTNPFGAKGPFYGPAGHHGADFAVGTHGGIPSYFTGTLVMNGHSSVLGNYSVYRRDDGVYAGFAHLLIGTRKNVGDRVRPGTILGKAAGAHDDHGSAWAGAHCHTTVSKYETGIWDGRTYDPVPSINARRVPKPSSRPAAGKKFTTAREGEGFIKIAARVGVSVDTLERLNHGVDGGNLRLGQRVYYA